MHYETLQNLARIRTGYPFRGRVEHDPNGETGVVQIRDLRQNPTLDPALITRTSLPGLNNRQLQPGDLLMPARGDHRTAVAFNRSDPTVASSQLFTLRVSEDAVMPAFLCWALNRPEAQHALANEARGSAIPALSRESLATLRVPVPPLHIQQRIVELLDLWQPETTLMRHLVTNREHMLNGMVQQLMNHSHRNNEVADAPTDDTAPKPNTHGDPQ